MNELSLSVRRTDGRVVITVSGDLDMACADRLTTLVGEQVPDDARAIVDLSGLTFLDSGGLGALMTMWKRLRRNGGDMVIAGASYKTAPALWLTGLADRLPRTATVQEALDGGATD